MSDSFLPPVSPSAASVDLTAHSIALPVKSGEEIIAQNIILDKLPASLEFIAKTLALRGQIRLIEAIDDQTNPKSNQKQIAYTLEITTAKGIVQAHIPPPDTTGKPVLPPPNTGQIVQINIQPPSTGQIPHSAILSYAALPLAHNTTPQARHTDTPLDVRLSSSSTTPPPQNGPQTQNSLILSNRRPVPRPLLTPGQIVQLSSVPPIQTRPADKIFPLNTGAPAISSALSNPVGTPAHIITTNQTGTLSGTVSAIANNTPPNIVEKTVFTPPSRTANSQTAAPSSPDPTPPVIPSPPSAPSLVYDPATPTPPPAHYTARHTINMRLESAEFAPPKLNQSTPNQHSFYNPAEPGNEILHGSLRAGLSRATLIGTNAQNMPLVRTVGTAASPGPTYALHIPADQVMPHDTLYLSPLSAFDDVWPLTAQSVQDMLTPAPTWPVIEESIHTLQNVASNLAHTMTALTPHAANPLHLGAAAMFFISALSGGEFSQWFGDKAMELLRQHAAKDLPGRLSQEGTLLGRSIESVSGDWRGTSFPVLVNNEFHKIALHYKHDDGGQDHDTGSGTQTRFIFDLSVPRMGAVQLDGLHRDTRLDLILRTEEPFSQAVQADMRRVFSDAMDEALLTGSLSFQNDSNAWVTIDAAVEHFGADV